MVKGRAPHFPETIVSADDYFPLKEGLQWKYAGKKVTQGMAEEKRFTNTVTVLGKEVINGIALIPFEEKDASGRGLLVRYYLKEKTGVVCYGYKPPVLLLQQVMPYLWVPLPIRIPHRFNQIDKKGLDTGRDYDGDGINESADMESSINVAGEESLSVPAGTYASAVRIEYRLTIRIHLTAGGKPKELTQHSTHWFAKGIGLVKRVDKGPGVRLGPWPPTIFEITEELEGISH